MMLYGDAIDRSFLFAKKQRYSNTPATDCSKKYPGPKGTLNLGPKLTKHRPRQGLLYQTTAGINHALSVDPDTVDAKRGGVYTFKPTGEVIYHTTRTNADRIGIKQEKIRMGTHRDTSTPANSHRLGWLPG